MNLKKELKSTCLEIISLCEREDDCKAVLDRAMQRIFELSLRNRKPEFKPASAAAPAGIFPDSLENLTGSNLFIINSKYAYERISALADIVIKYGIEKKRPMGLFLLEFLEDEIHSILLKRIAGIGYYETDKSGLSEDKQVKFAEAADILRNSHILIEDSGDLSIYEIKAAARELKSKYPDLGLIVIDNIRLIQHEKLSGKAKIKTGFLTGALEIMAREIGVPVVALRPLN